ncbi:MAG: hypothetical protein KatS3mg004_3247 [Bryobacteraceae bacterium]|nr:MAG: hypothetical protein KatS3mg004_3247 [Bryobacteraceae bacterium]
MTGPAAGRSFVCGARRGIRWLLKIRSSGNEMR